MLASLVPRPPPFLPSICVHNNTQEQKTREVYLGMRLVFLYCKLHGPGWNTVNATAQSQLSQAYSYAGACTQLTHPQPELLHAKGKIHGTSRNEGWLYVYKLVFLQRAL